MAIRVENKLPLLLVMSLHLACRALGTTADRQAGDFPAISGPQLPCLHMSQAFPDKESEIQKNPAAHKSQGWEGLGLGAD